MDLVSVSYTSKKDVPVYRYWLYKNMLSKKSFISFFTVIHFKTFIFAKHQLLTLFILDNYEKMEELERKKDQDKYVPKF